MKQIIILLLSTCWISCSEPRPPEIFKIEEMTEVKVDSITGEFKWKDEYFVIANPPEDTLALRTIVDAYIDSTLTLEEIKRYNSSYEMWFYSENYDDYEPFDSTRNPEKFMYFMKSDDGWTKNILRI